MVRMGLRAMTKRLAVGAAALFVTAAALVPGPATAQVDCVAEPADPACVPDETSTTVDGAVPDDATTTTTEAEPERTTTTTVRRTTTTEAPDDVPVADQEDAEVIEEPVTTLPERPALLVLGPPLVETAPVAPEIAQEERPAPAGESLDADPSSSSDDDRTRRTVTLAIAGLLMAAVLLGALTWWYWRRTKPTAAPTPAADPPAADPAAVVATVDGADGVDGSAPTGVTPTLEPEDADWHDDPARPPMAAPPGRVTDRAR